MYTGTCACGMTKYARVGVTGKASDASVFVTTKTSEEEEKRILSKGGWKCRTCGKVHPEFIGFCSCGMSRGKNKETEQATEQEIEKRNLEKVVVKEIVTNSAVGEDKKSTEIDKFEEIKRYKELLDCGIISETEFAKKKNELLNL